jgi:hypothetical protein
LTSALVFPTKNKNILSRTSSVAARRRRFGWRIFVGEFERRSRQQVKGRLETVMQCESVCRPWKPNTINGKYKMPV